MMGMSPAVYPGGRHSLGIALAVLNEDVVPSKTLGGPTVSCFEQVSIPIFAKGRGGRLGASWIGKSKCS